jgi:hypothetical protein
MLKDPKVSKIAILTQIPIILACLSGCGGNLMAPDPIVENPEAEAFLNRVAEQCADKTIGRSSLNMLINQTQDEDAYFTDLTTKLYFGKVSHQQYASDINSFYPIGDNQAGLDCIFEQLPPE